MSGEFFEMLDNMRIRGRRVGDFLNAEGKQVLQWDCRYGRPVTWSGALIAQIIAEGTPLDLLSNPWRAWVASEKARSVLDQCAHNCVQYIPLTIPDDPRPYFVANFTAVVACLDERLSHVERWQTDNQIRPDLAGEVSTLLDLHIDAEKAKGKHLFRLAEQTSHVLVSRTMKEALEQAGITGVKFQDATSPDIAEFRKRFAERQKQRKAI